MDRRVALPLVLLVSACIHVYQSIRPRPLDPHAPVTVTTPVKAHLVDGSTVVFLAGVTVDSAAVRGDGNRYSLTLRDSAAVNSIPLDSIVGMEAFEQSVNGFPSFFVSVLATGGAARNPQRSARDALRESSRTVGSHARRRGNRPRGRAQRAPPRGRSTRAL